MEVPLLFSYHRDPRVQDGLLEPDDTGLHGKRGMIEVTPYTGSNKLLKHGPLRKSGSCTYLEHADGTPFYWLADTWWMGFTTRLEWPASFQALTRDRVTKGFSVVQIVAGLYPDMEPFDVRGANEAGFPWTYGFENINPSYFDMADLKIAYLVDSGLTPCIVGCWRSGKVSILQDWVLVLEKG